MNRQPGTMEPPRHLDAGSSPRLDKLAPSGHQPPGCRLLRMPGAAACPAVASPPCRCMITRPAVLGACWSRPVARLLYSGHRPGCGMDEQHPPCSLVVLVGASPRLDKLAPSGHQPRGLMLDPHRNQPPRFTNSLKQEAIKSLTAINIE